MVMEAMKCHGHSDMWRTSCESGSAAVWCPANNFERKAEWQGETQYQARPALSHILIQRKKNSYM